MLIRPWECGDQRLVADAQQQLSERSLSRRFLVGTGGRLPSAYLTHIAKGARPPEWDAQVAVDRGQLCGWAEYGTIPGTGGSADLAVIVVDRWQREGVGSRLIRALVQRMVAAGIRQVYAEVLPENRDVQAFVRALAGAGTGPEGGYVDGLVRYHFPLVDVPAEMQGQNVGMATAV
ncbi:GNAT family N-acetyltransferase [Dactylosporangium sp. NPDC005572]|uniref:GNAT family N-acetyltransferase n=1 Tax=Dactylosporangium sp. NPDC005572 TaxID=3156889 RepID=UPI0033B9DB6C